MTFLEQEGSGSQNSDTILDMGPFTESSPDRTRAIRDDSLKDFCIMFV